MYTENLGSYNGSNREAVKDVDKGFPCLDVTPSFTFVIKTVYSGDISTFVISSQEKEVLWVLYLVAQEEEDGFEALLPSIDVVPEEEVVCSWRKATHFE